MAESHLPLEKALEMFREQDRTAALRRRASALAGAANERRRQEADRLASETTLEWFRECERRHEEAERLAKEGFIESMRRRQQREAQRQPSLNADTAPTAVPSALATAKRAFVGLSDAERAEFLAWARTA
jgi:hypothetical protein